MAVNLKDRDIRTSHYQILRLKQKIRNGRKTGTNIIRLPVNTKKYYEKTVKKRKD